MKNLTNYNRADHGTTNNYTVISNQLINDNNLNVIDKGIMLMILSNSDNFIYNSIVMQKKSGIGKIAFYSSIKKLITLGYINKQAIQGGYIWTINEAPIIAEQPQQPMEEQQPTEEAIIEPSVEPIEEISTISTNEIINVNKEPINKCDTIDEKKLFSEITDYINSDAYESVFDNINNINNHFTKKEITYLRKHFDDYKKSNPTLINLFNKIYMAI